MKIALGITGGIAAYKAAEIVRLLQDRGIRVQVVMTRAAQEFVRPSPSPRFREKKSSPGCLQLVKSMRPISTPQSNTLP
jgi:phosphopantothenoylcysteine synthetase/decarboxylase